MKKGKQYPHLWKARIGKCLVCKKEYRAVKDFKERKQKYCSADCYQKDWVKKIRPKLKQAHPKNELNPAWKGDDVGYHGIHKWIARQLGKPMKCDHCGDNSNRKYEWCNKDHKYKRDVKDWIRLCTPCHRKHDLLMIQ